MTSPVYSRANGNACTKSDWQDNVMGCKQTTYYTITNTVTTTKETDYTGQFALDGSLMSSSSLLSQLITTKQLGFGIKASGDMNLISASLNVDYKEVPEPGSLALFGIALLGAAGVRRARRG